jgi:hypothetical protein
MKEEENLILKIKKNFNQIYALERLNRKENENRDIFEDIPYTKEYGQREFQINLIKFDLRSNIIDLYKESLVLDYYYFDCPSSLYIKNFESRKKEYLDINIDADEKDFICSEVKYFNNSNINRVFFFDSILPNHYDDYIEYKERYKISLRRKLEYLSQNLEKYNLTIDIQEDTDILDEYNSYIGYGTEATIRTNVEKKIEPIESNSKNQLTTNQIVLLLQEIGFFTHPNIEDASKVKQAELISSITGIHQKTIKSNIEKLEKSPSVNGANYQKDIDKINKILNDLI